MGLTFCKDGQYGGSFRATGALTRTKEARRSACMHWKEDRVANAVVRVLDNRVLLAADRPTDICEGIRDLSSTFILQDDIVVLALKDAHGPTRRLFPRDTSDEDE